MIDTHPSLNITGRAPVPASYPMMQTTTPVPVDGGVEGGGLPKSAGSSFHGRRKPNGSACQRRTMAGVQDEAIPVGTRKIKVRLDIDQVSGATPNLAIDDVTLEIDPGDLRYLTFAVWQVSAQVGRGFRGIATVEV
jgi:hypothetical protein